MNIKKRIRQPSVRPELVEGSLSKEACRKKLVEGSLSKDKMVLFDKLRANGARWYYEKP